MEPVKDLEAGKALAAMLPGAVADEVLAAINGASVTMGRSPKVGDLIKAVCRAKLKFGAVVKDREANIPGKEGKQGYRYGYATLAAAAEATDQALAEEELNIFYLPTESPGYFAVTTELYHSSDQYKSCTISFELPRENIGPQGKGKLLTYGRRYGKFCMLDLAPEDDDDAGDLQQKFERSRGRAEDDMLSLDEVPKMAQADPGAAFAAVRKLVASVEGCGAISEPRQRRLYAVANTERGWSAAEVDQAVTHLLGAASVAHLPWKAYEQVVALFQNVTPWSFIAKEGAIGPPKEEAQPPAAAPQTGRQPQPGTAAEAAPLPSWREAWDKIRADFDDLSPQDLDNHIGPASAPAVLEGFMKAGGWTAQEIADVLRVELYGTTVEKLPKDGTHPPVYRKVAKAFRVYTAASVSAADRERYGWEAPPPHEEEPPFGDDQPTGEPSAVGEALALLDTVPATADEGWRAIRAAVDRIGQEAPEALVPLTPDDRLALFRKPANGNRSTGDVDALCRHHLGVRVESVPSLVFEHVLRLLAAFPSRTPGAEEVLAVLPADPGKSKPTELRDLLNRLIADKKLEEDEIVRSGEGGKVTKEDMIGTIERLRERALIEAGHA